MQTLLSLHEVSKWYTRGQTRVDALKSVSFSVNSGAFVSIVGRSGSGKSTLLNLVGGLDVPSSGALEFEDRNLAHASRKTLAMHRRCKVGMVFQSFNLIPSRTALENVELAMIFAGTAPSKRRHRARELLVRLGLEGRMDHRPGALSGGEAQRVAIARALANGPRMLLADEPTGNLDSRTASEIMELLAALNREGLTVLMVTHDRVTAESVSDRVLELLDGALLADRNLRRTP